MRIYFAGEAGVIEREERWLALVSTRLLSFFYIKENDYNNISWRIVNQTAKERHESK